MADLERAGYLLQVNKKQLRDESLADIQVRSGGAVRQDYKAVDEEELNCGEEVR